MNALPQNPEEPERFTLLVEDGADRGASRPPWMKPKAEKPSNNLQTAPQKLAAKRQKSAPSPEPGVKILVKDEFEVDLPWTERVKRWLKSIVAGSCATSLGIHVLLLAVLSLILMHTTEPPTGFITGVVDEGEDQFDFDDVVDVQLDVAAVETDSIQSPALRPLPISISDLALVTNLENSISSITSHGKGDLLHDSVGGFRMPASGKVVRKGSFTAWTVPEDPAPLQNYKIIVQVELPRGMRTYNQSDISGFMTGTDGYQTPIGQHRSGRGFRDGYYGEFNIQAKQLVITIPGAEKSIRDTIEVESRLLKEKQKLEIVF